jgi:hypothetical protein
MTGSGAKKSLAVLISMLLIVACQEEKFTDKGIPEVDITAVTLIEDGGALFEGRILSTGSEAVVQHGFLWDTDENPTLGRSEIADMGPGAGKGEFSFKAMADIEKDIVYYSRAFLKTDGLVAYSNVISFVGGGSLPPELVSIVPLSAVCGDTVTITGKNFSFTGNNNKVYFDNSQARVIYSKSDELRVIVPPAVELPIKVSATVAGLKSVNELDFTIMQPILSDYAPRSGTFDDIITLSGTNFCLDTLYVKVYFNNAQAEILELSRTHYMVKVPPENNVSPAVVQIKYFNYFSYNEQFTLKSPTISDISPVTVQSGEIIHITGENFNPLPYMNMVNIGGVEAQVINTTATEINVFVPAVLTAGHYMVKLSTIHGIDLLWNGSLEVLTPWRKLNDFPGVARSSAAVFSTESNGYMGLGHDDFSALTDFWRYSPEPDIWTHIQDFPIAGLDYATGFAIDGMGYVTCGEDGGTWYKALTRYNPGTDSWQTMTQKPGEGSSMKAPAFVINGRSYVPAAEEMYEYNPLMNTWVKKSYPSALGYFGSGVAFSIGDKGYMGIGWIHQQEKNTPMLFEYDPSTDQWTRKADFPGTLRSNTVFFSLPNGKAYVGLGTTLDYQYLKDLWEYNPVTDSWRRVEDFPGTGRYSSVAFTIGDKAYIGVGYDGTFKSDFWEFSPAD